MTFAIALILLAFAVVAWKSEKHALTLLAALLPTYLLRFSIGPVPMTVLEGCLIIATVGWIARGGLRRVAVLRPFVMPAILLVLASVIAVIVAPSTVAALGLWRAYIAEPIVLFAMLVTTFNQREDWTRAGKALVASGVVVAVLGIAQWLFGVDIPAPWDMERRVTSVYDFPNAVGLFLAPIVAMTVVLLRKNGARMLAVLLMILAIIFAQTEAAFVAIPAALLIVLLLSRVSLRTKSMVTASAVILFFLAFTAVPVVREKILLNDISGQARTTMWDETMRMLADRPLTGAGLSGFPATIAPYHDATLFEVFQYPHNVVLNIWTELGVLGLLAALVIAVIVCRAAWRYRDDPFVLAAFAALVVMVVHGLVDVPFFKNDLALFTTGLLAFLTWRATQKTA